MTKDYPPTQTKEEIEKEKQALQAKADAIEAKIAEEKSNQRAEALRKFNEFIAGQTLTADQLAQTRKAFGVEEEAEDDKLRPHNLDDKDNELEPAKVAAPEPDELGPLDLDNDNEKKETKEPKSRTPEQQGKVDGAFRDKMQSLLNKEKWLEQEEKGNYALREKIRANELILRGLEQKKGENTKKTVEPATVNPAPAAVNTAPGVTPDAQKKNVGPSNKTEILKEQLGELSFGKTFPKVWKYFKNGDRRKEIKRTIERTKREEENMDRWINVSPKGKQEAKENFEKGVRDFNEITSQRSEIYKQIEAVREQIKVANDAQKKVLKEEEDKLLLERQKKFIKLEDLKESLELNMKKTFPLPYFLARKVTDPIIDGYLRDRSDHKEEGEEYISLTGIDAGYYFYKSFDETVEYIQAIYKNKSRTSIYGDEDFCVDFNTAGFSLRISEPNPKNVGDYGGYHFEVDDNNDNNEIYKIADQNGRIMYEVQGYQAAKKIYIERTNEYIKQVEEEFNNLVNKQ